MARRAGVGNDVTTKILKQKQCKLKFLNRLVGLWFLPVGGERCSLIEGFLVFHGRGELILLCF